jgi:CheY-like chemotaxis protein
MTDAPTGLEGLRILVAEDEALIAIDLETMLQDLGCEVVGPLPSLQLVVRAAGAERIDGAILDVNLRGEHIFPVLPILRQRKVPVVLSSGYNDPDLVPAEFRGVPLITKPYDQAALRAICSATFRPEKA